MDIPYLLMVLVSIAALLLAWSIRPLPRFALVIGSLSWIALAAYPVGELYVMRATTASYDPLHQPMSDLGVTVCGDQPYSLANYNVCSPEHMLMNWLFVLLGVAIAVGAICLHRQWPPGRRAKTVTILWIIYGFSFILSGAIPADINFLAHTLWSMPSMIVQVPALLLLAGIMQDRRPHLATWTYIWAALNITTLVALVLSAIVELPFSAPAGLLQRALYLTIIVWAIGAAIYAARAPSWETPYPQDSTDDLVTPAGPRNRS